MADLTPSYSFPVAVNDIACIYWHILLDSEESRHLCKIAYFIINECNLIGKTGPKCSVAVAPDEAEKAVDIVVCPIHKLPYFFLALLQ